MAKLHFPLRNQRLQSYPSVNPSRWSEPASSTGGIGYQILSFFAHGLIVVGALFAPTIQHAPEVIEFELNAGGGFSAPAAPPAPHTASTIAAASPVPPRANDDAGTQTPAPTRIKIQKTQAKASARTASPKAVAPVKAAAVSNSESSEVTDTETEPAPTEFDPNELDEMLDEVKASTLTDSSKDEELSELDETLEQTKQELAAQSEEVKSAWDEEREASEKAEAEARRRALARELAQARYQREMAKAAAAAAKAQEQGTGTGGQGQTSGAAVGSAGPVGTGPVRKLSQLRQMPGNKKPRYDVPDRMAGREGRVALLAFIEPSGSIQKIKMTKSSGHRSLDEKTLRAIREWKFYPGQQGWVEIPFEWTLKGEVQEKPTPLRRQVKL